MDIQINAAQGRGKTTIAPKIAALFGGIYREIDATVSGPIFNQGALRYAIVESRADVVIIDQCETWFLRQAKEAVQAARHQLHRDVVAIYLIQDHTIGVKSASSVSMCGRQMTPQEIASMKTAVSKSDDIVGRSEYVSTDRFPVASGSVNETVETSRTKGILMELVRCVRANGGPDDLTVLDDIYTHYGAESLEDLAPAFFPEAHAKLMMLRDRAECRTIVVDLAKSSRAPEAKGILEKYGYTRVSEIQLADAAAVLVDLKIAQSSVQ